MNESLKSVKSDKRIKGKFAPGNNCNPSGRPRKPEIELVRQAIAETEIEKKKGFWKHLIEQCYKDNALLAAVAKKFLPDKIETEIYDRQTAEELALLRERTREYLTKESRLIDLKVINDK